MLKILIGSTLYEKYFNDDRYIDYPNQYFNQVKEQEWFNDKTVQDIINHIDNASIEIGFAVRHNVTGAGYSVNDLSGGAKTLILIHKLRDEVFLATMGDNCTDIIEQIALDYEKEGKDLIIVSNYLHRFNFKYINDIEYINYNIICHSKSDIFNKIYPLYNKTMQQVLYEREG